MTLKTRNNAQNDKATQSSLHFPFNLYEAN
jgi:hypothetical protein